MAIQRNVEPTEEDKEISEDIVRFVNVAWGRALRASPGLWRAVAEARLAGYTYQQMLLVYWSAAGGANEYAMDMMAKNKGWTASLFLRFKGGQNVYGSEAKRWLDELYEILGDSNPKLITALMERLQKVDPELAKKHGELLQAYGVPGAPA